MNTNARNRAGLAGAIALGSCGSARTAASRRDRGRRAVAIVLAALVPAVLLGCNSQQQVEANNAAKRAQTQVQNAARKADSALTDAGMTLKVKTAMAASSKLNTSGINVDTKNRVVHLKGTVTSADQKALAERIALDTVGPGVTVLDELAVQPHPARSR